MTMQKSSKERINVIFPKDVLNELRRLVPSKERSRVIVEATAARLALLRQQEAVKQAAGTWSDEDYPQLNSESDLERWVAEIRGSWQTRQRLFEGEDASF
ncbi:hypothetical protein M1O16_00510 [Dehalococcoidia bacterium]|nr:hypothetical protein [Dehalococcoidia bacterium]MCL0103160.1 hypothetical protein [Dehalococcoidia bacterium]